MLPECEIEYNKTTGIFQSFCLQLLLCCFYCTTSVFSFWLSDSSRFLNATLTASTTNAVNVQSLSFIAFSIPSRTSFGNRMLLLVVRGTTGILNLSICGTPHFKCIPVQNTFVLQNYLSHKCVAGAGCYVIITAEKIIYERGF